jgi:hypothetical protein
LPSVEDIAKPTVYRLIQIYKCHARTYAADLVK